ncbi:MAG: GNAT family acetyltransferase [Alphaproteobacteria bacterium]
MRLHRLRLSHVEAIDLQPSQAALRDQLSGAVIQGLVRSRAIAIVDGADVLVCAGLARRWPGRTVGWALLSHKIRPNRFLAVHRLIAAALDRAEMRDPGRIEVQIDPSHAAALRWARLLGFEVEGRMCRYLPDGRDMILMARVS